MNKKRSVSTKALVISAILTALVILLQLFAGGIKLGPFSISLVLVPIVLGSAIGGPLAGAWLGLVFGITVLISGDAAAFLAVNPGGTVVTVLLKGIMAGLLAGIIYRLIAKKNKNIAVFASAIICPVVNTGVFLLGCLLFFMETITQWAISFGFESAASYMIFGLAGLNFLTELVINLILAPIILRLLKIEKM